MNAGGLRALVVIAGASILPGCATMVENDWHDRPTHASLPAHHLEVPAAELTRHCGEHPGKRLYGCAIRVVDARVCIIYTSPQPAAWLIEHERKHCAGWDHGPHRAPQTRVAAAG